jgi:hypothetical protein
LSVIQVILEIVKATKFIIALNKSFHPNFFKPMTLEVSWAGSADLITKTNPGREMPLSRFHADLDEVDPLCTLLNHRISFCIYCG